MTATKQNGPFPRIRRIFFAGILTVLPLTLTVMVFVWLVDYIKTFLGPTSAFGNFMESFGLRFVSSEQSAYLLGLVAVIGLVFLLGALVEAGMRNRLQILTDSILNRVPLVRSVYNALSKIVRMFDDNEQTDLKSMQAIMCYFGGDKNGSGVLALLTSPETIVQNDIEYYTVLIPTAPVPVGGAILFVPVDWVETVDINFEGLLNIYMSMGVTSPDYFNTVKTPAT